MQKILEIDFPLPQTIDEILGQESTLGPTRPLGRAIRSGLISHLILYGPPGSGKTSFAKVLRNHIGAEFLELNATSDSIKEIKNLLEDAILKFQKTGLKTLVFLDEIHHFNRNQQDVLLSFLEKSGILFIGATSEPPGAEINRALLSRCMYIKFNKISLPQIEDFLKDQLQKIYFKNFQVERVAADLAQAQVLSSISRVSNGDLRQAFILLRALLAGRSESDFPIPLTDLDHLFSSQGISRFENEDLLSAMIKSIRGSDPDSALVYGFAMLKNHVDVRLILRRLIVLASEDIGNADPRALPFAVSAMQGFDAVGLPEGEIIIAQLICFLSACPKSNSAYVARSVAKNILSNTPQPTPPSEITSLASDKYNNPHRSPKAWNSQKYWPLNINPIKIYQPSDRGMEKRVREYFEWLKSGVMKDE